MDADAERAERFTGHKVSRTGGRQIGVQK